MFAVIGGVLLGVGMLLGAFDVVRVSQATVTIIVGLGGLCLAAFLVLGEMEQGSAPGPLVEQEERGHARALGREDTPPERPAGRH